MFQPSQGLAATPAALSKAQLRGRSLESEIIIRGLMSDLRRPYYAGLRVPELCGLDDPFHLLSSGNGRFDHVPIVSG
jgi:hypothetical protein